MPEATTPDPKDVAEAVEVIYESAFGKIVAALIVGMAIGAVLILYYGNKIKKEDLE